MTEDEVVRLDAWISSALPLVTPGRAQTEHLDRLFSVPARPDMIALGLDAYRQSILRLGMRTTTIMAALVIPLGDVEKLVPSAPRSDDILLECSNEPPTLALIHREALKSIPRVEEYRAPATIPRLADVSDSYCFYRVFRDENAMRRGWEFGRCITIYHVGAQGAISP